MCRSHIGNCIVNRVLIACSVGWLLACLPACSNTVYRVGGWAGGRVGVVVFQTRRVHTLRQKTDSVGFKDADSDTRAHAHAPLLQGSAVFQGARFIRPWEARGVPVHMAAVSV